ncbi:MAG: DUF4159 domain-containing protein [Candidatus Omnitrophica bacterium]|nr:DUF4159 domain-containing protein [Candidatus Omnitrophota bacterium]
MKIRQRLLLIVFLVLGMNAASDPDLFTIGRLKYSGGGDWYSDPTSLPNLLRELRERFKIDTAREEAVVSPMDAELFQHPLIYMTGHGTVKFSDEEVERLREYFRRGGVLWADDNYGMDESFRKEIGRIFPDNPLQEIPVDHPIFSIYYHFPKGTPKIHEHDGGPPHLLGIFSNGRLAVLYTFNTDIGDGIESEGVHPQDPPEVREQAMKMALNLVLFILSS